MITIGIYRRPDRVNDEELAQIEKELPPLASKIFHHGWTLMSGKDDTERESQIMIVVHDFGSLDVNIMDLYIGINAGFPEPFNRTYIDDERKEAVKGIQEIIDRVTSARKGQFPSYIICRVEVFSSFSSSEEIQSKLK